VIECDIENPSDSPHGCPPAVSQVAAYRNGKIHRLNWHFPVRAARYEDLDTTEGAEPHAGSSAARGAYRHWGPWAKSLDSLS
jgi:hypothetical protein